MNNMSTFKEYLTDNVNYEEVISYIKEEADLDKLNEELVSIETRLDEFLGLGKLASKLSSKAEEKAKEEKKAANDKLKMAFETTKKEKEKIAEKEGKKKATADKISGFSKAADEKIEGVKKGISDKLQSAKANLQGKKYAAERVIASAASTVEEKKEAAKQSYLRISAGAKSLFKKMYKNIAEASEDQKKTIADIEGIYKKLSDNEHVSGVEAIKILATVLAGSPESGEIPAYKAYRRQLDKLRTLPGFSGFKFSVETNK